MNDENNGKSAVPRREGSHTPLCRSTNTVSKKKAYTMISIIAGALLAGEIATILSQIILKKFFSSDNHPEKQKTQIPSGKYQMQHQPSFFGQQFIRFCRSCIAVHQKKYRQTDIYGDYSVNTYCNTMRRVDRRSGLTVERCDNYQHQSLLNDIFSQEYLYGVSVFCSRTSQAPNNIRFWFRKEKDVTWVDYNVSSKVATKPYGVLKDIVEIYGNSYFTDYNEALFGFCASDYLTVDNKVQEKIEKKNEVSTVVVHTGQKRQVFSGTFQSFSVQDLPRVLRPLFFAALAHVVNNQPRKIVHACNVRAIN